MFVPAVAVQQVRPTRGDRACRKHSFGVEAGCSPNGWGGRRDSGGCDWPPLRHNFPRPGRPHERRVLGAGSPIRASEPDLWIVAIPPANDRTQVTVGRVELGRVAFSDMSGRVTKCFEARSGWRSVRSWELRLSQSSSLLSLDRWSTLHDQRTRFPSPRQSRCPHLLAPWLGARPGGHP